MEGETSLEGGVGSGRGREESRRIRDGGGEEMEEG